jgi:dsDNA-binding SOS-regulon protein
MLRKHYPGVERMTQTDRAIAKAAPSLLDLADKLARMVVNEDQSIDKAHGVAATAYLKARGI